MGGVARYTTCMAAERIVIEPDPVVEVFKKDIDRTLLRAAVQKNRS